MISWKKNLENVIDDFKDKRYNSNHFEKRNTLTISSKMDMTDDFYIKHNMHAVEWKLNALVNKIKSLINKFNETWRHPLNRKFRNNRIEMIDYNNRKWSKMINSKHKHFRICRSRRNVKPDQVIKTTYDVMITVAVLDNLVLYIMPSESF